MPVHLSCLFQKSFVTFVAIYSDLEVHVWTSPACFSDENMLMFPFMRGWWCLVCSTECCWTLRWIKLQHINIHQVSGEPARVRVGSCLSHIYWWFCYFLPSKYVITFTYLEGRKCFLSNKASETLLLKLLHSGSVKKGLLFHRSTRVYLSVFLDFYVFYDCFHCCSCEI